jgi:hypothetical protein
MLDLVRTLKTRYGLKIVVVTNDGREFIVHRIQRFGLKEFVDFFVVSCFVDSLVSTDYRCFSRSGLWCAQGSARWPVHPSSLPP